MYGSKNRERKIKWKVEIEWYSEKRKKYIDNRMIQIAIRHRCKVKWQYQSSGFFSRGPHWQAAGSSSGCIVWTLIINLTIVITQRYCSMKLKKIHQNYFPVLARPPKKRKWYACVRLSTVFLIIYLMNKHIFHIFFTRCFFSTCV